MSDNTELYESMPIKKAVLRLAVPTIISQLITVIYNMTDTFFIGQLGDYNQVAAATLSMPVFIMLTGFANFFGIGGAAAISRFLGEGRRGSAKKCSSFCVWTSVTVVLFYGLVVYYFRYPILHLIGSDEGTYDYTVNYIFWTVAVGAVPTVLSSELAHLIRGEGNSRKAGFGIAMGGILNMILDPILIFGFRMQITGAAVATLLSNTAALLYFMTVIYRTRKESVITLSPAHYCIREGIPSDVMTSGAPSFAMTLMGTLSNSILNGMIAGYSNAAVAGIGIAKKIDFLAIATAQGLSQGVVSMIAYNYAAENKKRMEDAIKTSFAFSMGLALVTMTFLLIASRPITAAFIRNAETVEYGHHFLQIISLSCPSTAMNYLIITVFQATKHKVQPIILSCLRKGLLDVPLMFILNSAIGINGILWATPISDLMTFAVGTYMLLNIRSKNA